MRIVLLFIFSILFVLSCKQVREKTEKIQTSVTSSKKDSKVGNVFLPKEISNKEWVILNPKVIEYPDKNIVCKNENEIFIDFIEYRRLIVKKIERKENGFLIFVDEIADFLDFSWIDKNARVAKWELKKEDDVLKTYITVEKGKDISKKQKQEIFKSLQKRQNQSNLPDTEKIPDDYEGFYQCNDSEGITRIVNGDNIILKLNNNLTISTTSRKIEKLKNKYGLLFKEVVNSNSNFNQNFYSKSKFIAELEILSAEEIKTNWLGFFNTKTKKIEKQWNVTWNKKGCEKISYWE